MTYSDEFAAAYLQKFTDPATVKWHLVDQADDHTRAMVTPNGATVLLSANMDWRQDFAHQVHSTRLHVLSLGFLAKLVSNDSAETDRELAAAIVEAFASFYADDNNAEFVRSILSADHGAAIRIRVLCQLILMLRASNVKNKRLETAVLDIVRRDCDWACGDDVIPNNNHGMMLAIAMLHAGTIIEIKQKTAKSWSSHATQRLSAMFATIFDKDGFTDENTIGYHEFYCKTLGDLAEFLSFNPRFDQFRHHILTLHGAANNALQKVVLPTGAIPPIGDSGHYGTRYPSISGIHIFSDSGIAVRKSAHSYVSIICGARSETHKHMDDTSITINFRGRDLLIDAGIMNYDWSDPGRQCVQSQRGHSGLYFPTFDSFLRQAFIRKQKDYAAKLEVDAWTSERLKLTCRYSLADGQYQAVREISFRSETAFDIHDSFVAPPGESAVQRFIIPPEATIVDDNGTLIVTNAASQLRLRPQYGTTYTICSGATEPMMKGWRSLRFNHIEATHCLEIYPPPGDRRFFTEIDFGDAIAG